MHAACRGLERATEGHDSAVGSDRLVSPETEIRKVWRALRHARSWTNDPLGLELDPDDFPDEMDQPSELFGGEMKRKQFAEERIVGSEPPTPDEVAPGLCLSYGRLR